MQAYRTITVEPNRDGFGAAITGPDLAAPLDAAIRSEILDAWARHAVLFFPEQRLDAATVEGFTADIGPFGVDPYVEPIDGHEHVIEVRRNAAETAPIFGSRWHSDWSFQQQPPSGTVLYGVDVPPVGGDTLFADGCRAYEALSPTMQDLLSELKAVHSATRAYGPSGLFSRDDESRSMRIVVSEKAEASEVHPVVRTHPLSGRKTLYVNHVYTLAIEGLHPKESRALLDFLFKHMTQAAFVYRHRWHANMLTMWDNRCVMHYADGGYDGHRRIMLRTTVAGERPR